MAVSMASMPFNFFHFKWKNYTFMENSTSGPVLFRTHFMGSIEWSLQVIYRKIDSAFADFQLVLKVSKHDEVYVSNCGTLGSLSINMFLKFTEMPDIFSETLNNYKFTKKYSSDFRQEVPGYIRNGGFRLDLIIYPNYCSLELAETYLDRSNNDIVAGKFHSERKDETLLLNQLRILFESEKFFDYTMRCHTKTKLAHKFIIYHRLGNLSGEEIDGHVRSEYKGESFLPVTEQIFDSLLLYAYQAKVESIKKLLKDEKTREAMIACLTDHKMWKLYLHLTSNYTRHELSSLGEQGKQSFSITFPLRRNEDGEIYYFFSQDLQLQPPTIAEGALLKLTFRGRSSLDLYVYLRLLQPTQGKGVIVIHGYKNLRMTHKFNIAQRDIFLWHSKDVLPESVLRNLYNRTVTFDVNFYFRDVALNGTSERFVESDSVYTPLESLKFDLRNAYVRKVWPNCVVSHENPSQAEEPIKIPTHKAILKYRLDLPEDKIREEVELKLSEKSLGILMEYAYCGMLYIPIVPRIALEEFRRLTHELQQKSPLVQRLVDSLNNFLILKQKITDESMEKQFRKLKIYKLTKEF